MITKDGYTSSLAPAELTSPTFTICSLDGHLLAQERWNSEHSYLYNNARQRPNHLRKDASYVHYAYDNAGHLQMAEAYTSGNTPIFH
jgi:hypothetical protein